MSTDVKDLAVQDLAGQLYLLPHVWQTRSRIDRLLDRYLKLDYLSDRLADLPVQFVRPQPRAWQAVCWQDIDTSRQNPEKLNDKHISRLGLANNFRLVMGLLDWRTWQPASKLELAYTFLRVMQRLWQWKDSLDASYLQDLFGIPTQADSFGFPELLASHASNMEIANDR
jgi:hypothetical protein